MKIRITEKDIHYILKESTKCIKKILKEYGTSFDPRSLSGFFNIIEYVYDYADVDEEIVEQFFTKYSSIPQELEYEIHETGGVFGAGPNDYGGDIVEDKDTIARIQQINSVLNQITPATSEEAKICQTIQSVIDELENPSSVDDLDYKLGGYFNNRSYLGQGDWEPDPDTMPGGHDYYEESRDILKEHDPDDPDYGQYGDWYEKQAWKSLIRNGLSIVSLSDFYKENRNFDLNLNTVDLYVDHNIGTIGFNDNDNPDELMVTVFPSQISFESDGNMCIDDIDWDTEGVPQNLFDIIDTFIENNEEAIIDRIYN